jgi:hypothetical protein
MMSAAHMRERMMSIMDMALAMNKEGGCVHALAVKFVLEDALTGVMLDVDVSKSDRKRFAMDAIKRGLALSAEHGSQEWMRGRLSRVVDDAIMLSLEGTQEKKWLHCVLASLLVENAMLGTIDDSAVLP